MKALVIIGILGCFASAGCATSRPSGDEVLVARASANAAGQRYSDCMVGYPSTLPRNSESPESIAMAARSACLGALAEFAKLTADYSNLRNAAEAGFLTRRAEVTQFDSLIQETCSKLQSSESAKVVRIVVESRGR